MNSDVASPSSPPHAKDTGTAGPGAQPPQAPHDRPRPAVPAATQNHALFLDVDGTLLEIAHHPDAVAVTAELVSLLERLDRQLQGALALISGRSLEGLDRLFAPLKLCAAGVHGLERRGAGGVLHRPEACAQLSALRGPLADFAAARQGLLVEDKQQSLALHYRAAPAHADEAEAFLREFLRDHPGLRLLHGKMVFEIRPGGTDKGTAIADFMSEVPFKDRTPVFIGDDVTDEDGFATVNRLGGLSIRVGDGSDSAARFQLADEAAVFAWLHAWLGDPAEKDKA